MRFFERPLRVQTWTARIELEDSSSEEISESSAASGIEQAAEGITSDAFLSAFDQSSCQCCHAFANFLGPPRHACPSC